jgi:hypothetical protein
MNMTNTSAVYSAAFVLHWKGWAGQITKLVMADRKYCLHQYRKGEKNGNWGYQRNIGDSS